MIKIVIYSTKGKQKVEHETNATTWGELRQELSSIFDFNNLVATENVTRRDLTVDSAVLPTEDFHLFLRPVSTKLGGYSYKEAKEIIKNSPDHVKEAIKKYFNKNYTNLSTEDLNFCIEKFCKSASKPTTPTPKIVEEVEDADFEEDEDVEDISQFSLRLFKEDLDSLCQLHGITRYCITIEFDGSKKTFENLVSREETLLDELEKEVKELFG